MKVYLASRFSRLPELLGYKTELEELGIEVTSRWLLGGHEWVGTDDDALPLEVGAGFAADDIADINAADAIVCFTEAPRSGPSRGGRHIEAGYALARKKILVVVGHRENVFYTLPQVHFCETWDEALASIAVGLRTCRVCNRTHRLNDFYQCGVQKRSRTRVCRFCLIARTRHAIDRDPERHNEYGKRSYRRNPAKRRAAVDEWIARHPGANEAHLAVRRALRSGALVKPDICEACGQTGRLHAHHDDYALPLAVNWLCARCHRALHAPSDQLRSNAVAVAS